MGGSAPPAMVATQVRREAGGVRRRSTRGAWGRKWAQSAGMVSAAAPAPRLTRRPPGTRVGRKRVEGREAAEARRGRGRESCGGPRPRPAPLRALSTLSLAALNPDRPSAAPPLNLSSHLHTQQQQQQQQEELRAAKVPLGDRDYCAHLLIPLNECRRKALYMPWACGAQRHAYEKCLYFDYKKRVEARAEEVAGKE
jgi:NADH dehydrogenase (ubiquinone) 1 beta subcomplex subunit 7